MDAGAPMMANTSQIATSGDVWQHLQFGDELVEKRPHSGDQGINILLCCECDWEAERGLQIVFKNGLRVNKIGWH